MIYPVLVELVRIFVDFVLFIPRWVSTIMDEVFEVVQ